MKLYLDTSSLFKLYHNEVGTEEMDQLFSTNDITAIFLSELTNVEFFSALLKRVRMKEMSIENADEIIKLFKEDLKKYTIITVNTEVFENAKHLILKYRQDGLRALDALQLASALEVKNIATKYLTADKLLLSLFEKEDLPTA